MAQVWSLNGKKEVPTNDIIKYASESRYTIALQKLNTAVDILFRGLVVHFPNAFCFSREIWNSKVLTANNMSPT